jgi:hypothetical protein
MGMHNVTARVHKHHSPAKIEAKTKAPNSKRKYYKINDRTQSVDL